MAIDLVCGMEVDEKTAKNISTYNGEKYYFCSKHCKEQFDSDPQKYILKKKSTSSPPSPKGEGIALFRKE